ncbi:hypothetical protein C0Q70_15235 [Pomacea canaliculata]|uniref:glutathione transferase n=1 Tax=Pomacea canaliculata TaxID=400727 RepID=A0A2T7NU96_POMCA|nr:hypothetical protein C0Q70_15235 [Pomacea canaliculata]
MWFSSKSTQLAQPIRLLLNYVGEDFEDLYYEQGDAPGYSREAWYKVKYTLGFPFPNLPYYIDGDTKITQSNAILRYIAGKHNLLGQTEEEKLNVDILLEYAMDYRNIIVRLAYNPEYEKLLPEFITKSKIEVLPTCEKWLSDKKWFCGDSVTVADFPIYEQFDQARIMVPGILDEFPKITAFMKAFEELPGIKKYMSSPKFMVRPINNKSATFK